MALRASPDELVYEGVREVARDVREIGPVTLRVIRGSLQYAGDIAAAGEGEEAASVAVAASEGIFDVGVFFLVAAVLLVIELAYWVHLLLDNLLGRIPWVGGRLVAINDVAFAFTAPGVGWCAETMNHAAAGVFQGLERMVEWALSRTRGVPNAILNAAIAAYVTPVKHEADTLWSWVNTIEHRVQWLTGQVHGEANPASYNGPAILDRIHAVEHAIAVVNAAIGEIHGEIQAVSAEQAALLAQVYALIGSVHGARAVSSGFQDLASQVAQLTGEVHALQAHVQPTIDVHTGQLNMLYPLGVLLDAGAQGLQNLRTLEDNMCQCPRLPNLGDERALAMSLLHHLKGD